MPLSIGFCARQLTQVKHTHTHTHTHERHPPTHSHTHTHSEMPLVLLKRKACAHCFRVRDVNFTFYFTFYFTVKFTSNKTGPVLFYFTSLLSSPPSPSPSPRPPVQHVQPDGKQIFLTTAGKLVCPHGECSGTICHWLREER